MASDIEYEEQYLALQKEYNQTLKDCVDIILKYTALQAKCERYQKTLIAIGNGCATPQRKANEALSGEGKKEPTFTMEQVNSMLVEFALSYNRRPNKDIANDAVEYLNDKLGKGKKGKSAKEGVIRLLLSAAEDVSNDGDTAKAYLESEGMDMVKLKDDAMFVAWLAELAKLLHGAADGQPIKINQAEARKWFDDGMTPYQCFRETWNME